MLHPLEALPTEVETKLLALVDRQQELLEFAVNTSSNTRLLRDHGSYDFTEAAETLLRSKLGDNFTDWLSLVEYTGIRINLERLVGHSKADKESVLRDFDHDQAFWLDDDPSFRFAFDPRKSAAHGAAKGCLNPFFERFFGFELLLPDGTGFRKREIYDGYVSKNPTIDRVCGFCDGSMKRDRPKRQRKEYTLEHFFHKELHPSICMHPYNLIPCCDVCNDLRGEHEVLEVDGRALALGEIFHPLLRPARENVELRYYSDDLQPEELEFMRIHVEAWESAISVYSKLYRIPERWLEMWTDIDSVVSGRLRGLIESHRTSGNDEISFNDFEKMVHAAIRSLQGYAYRFEYPAHHWLMWARNDSRRLELLYRSHVETRDLAAPVAK